MLDAVMLEDTVIFCCYCLEIYYTAGIEVLRMFSDEHDRPLVENQKSHLIYIQFPSEMAVLPRHMKKQIHQNLFVVLLSCYYYYQQQLLLLRCLQQSELDRIP